MLSDLQFINVSSLSIALGLTTASDTLSSQVSCWWGFTLKNMGGGGQCIAKLGFDDTADIPGQEAV
jgi:hypothetical protein